MKRIFTVKEDTCFVALISQGKTDAGLILNGESKMEEFCKAAIDAYDEILRNKAKKKRFDKIMASPK